jgi:hypothetical protein
MRTTLVILALTGLCATSALADETTLASPPSRTVYLDGPADLARLREVNPGHYARAERILAAANQLCRPGPGRLLGTLGARELECAAELLTSNPPKRRLTFTLDDTRYIALATITDDPPRLIPAD